LRAFAERPSHGYAVSFRDVYRHEQMRNFTFPAERGRGKVPPDTLFVYMKPPNAYYGYFDEVVDESPHSLVSAAEVVEAIEELRRRGLGTRDIARAAGISLDSAYRAVAGNGQIRRNTRDAIRAAATATGSARAS
jgi:DNA-binding phage protein